MSAAAIYAIISAQNIDLILALFTALILLWTGVAYWRSYWLQARPHITFSLEWHDPQNPFHMFVLMRNDSRTDIKALVTAKVLANGNMRAIDDLAYSGQMLWTVPAQHNIQGHKNIASLIEKDVESQSAISIQLSVCYKEWSRSKSRLVGKKRSIPLMKWEYSHSRKVFIPVITDENKPDFSCE